MVTSGGYIAAACTVLSEAGHDVADMAFTVDRPVSRKGDPLGILVEERPRPAVDVPPKAARVRRRRVELDA